MTGSPVILSDVIKHFTTLNKLNNHHKKFNTVQFKFTIFKSKLSVLKSVNIKKVLLSISL